MAIESDSEKAGESMPKVYVRHCGTQFSTLSQKMPFPATQADAVLRDMTLWDTGPNQWTMDGPTEDVPLRVLI